MVKWVVFFAALFVLGWFVSFQYDPYRVCIDHPDKSKRDDYYLCQPFDFELQKGTRLERPADDRFIWEKRGDVIIGTATPEKRTKNKPNIIDNMNCRPEFFQLSPAQLSTIKLEDYCSTKGQSFKHPLLKNGNEVKELIPSSSQEEL